MRIYFGALLGVYFLAYLPVNWWQWWGLTLGLVGVLVFARQRLVGLISAKRKVLMSLSLIVVALGSFWHAQGSQQIQLPQYLHKQPVLISGCYQLISSTTRSVNLRVQQPRILISDISTNKQAVKSWYRFGDADSSSYMQLSVYDKHLVTAFKSQPKGRLVAKAILSKPRNYHNPDGFDYVVWSQRQGQLSRGYIKQSYAQWRPCPSFFPSWISQGRQYFLQQLSDIPRMGMGQVLWAALIAGHSKGLESADWQVLHRTGTTHLLVISGLHIGLVAALFMWLGSRIANVAGLVQGRELGIWLGWLAGLTYAVFSGWGLPAQRAMIMLSALMLVNRLGLGWSVWQRLLLAWVATLLLQPSSMYSPGFWYSYVAVANLALVIEQRKANSWQQWLVSGLLSQIALLAMLVPLIGVMTGGLSLVGPVINLLLIPLFGLVVVPMLLLVSLCLPLLGADHWLLWLVAQGLDYLWQLLTWTASWPYAMLNVGHWPIAVWLVWGLVGCFALVLRNYVLCLFITLCSTLVAILSTLSAGTSEAKGGVDQITVFDVGQGLAIWLQSGDQHRLYDLGDRYSSGFNLLEAVILPALNRAGVSSLDRVYIGHWDKDHSGGLQALARQFNLPVSKWWLPRESRLQLEKFVPIGADVQRCHTTPWQAFGTFKLRHISLWEQGMRGNDASCVMQVEWREQRLLIAGDIEKPAERLLVELYGASLQSDILVSPHHGSRTSSDELFLNWVAPRSVIISAGYRNRFAHPHPQVIERYWRHGIQWYNTALHGQVRIKSNADGVLVIEHTYN